MEKETQNILDSPIGNSILGTILKKKLLPEEEAIQLTLECVGNYHSLVEFSQTLFKSPIILANDVLGGRFVPIYPNQNMQRINLDLRALSIRVFKSVWGIIPKENDIEALTEEIKNYLKEQSNSISAKDESNC